jgi:hypothetical protein
LRTKLLDYASFFSLSSWYNKEVTRERSRLNKRAHQKPSTLNPAIKFSANNIISALITNRKSPRVTRVIGKVRMISMGFTIAFRTAKTMATIIAVQKVSMEMPLNKYDKPKATMDVTMMRMINLISIVLVGTS